jgi:hypothetical protein
MPHETAAAGAILQESGAGQREIFSAARAKVERRAGTGAFRAISRLAGGSLNKNIMNSSIKLSDKALKEAVASLHVQLQLKKATTEKVDFCKIWPMAKAILQQIATAIPAAAWAVGIIVAIGDAYFRKHCGA